MIGFTDFRNRSDAPPINHSSDIFCYLTKYGDALKAYEHAINLDPCAIAYARKGVVLQKLKFYEEGLAAFKEAICLDPNEVDYLKNKCAILGPLRCHEVPLAACEYAIPLDSSKDS